MIGVCYLSPQFRPYICGPINFELGNKTDTCLSAIEAFLFLPFAIHTVHQATSKSDRILGDLAYPIYLFHWIPVTLGFAYNTFPSPFRFSIVVTISIAVAALLHFMVDVPSERLRRHFVKSRLKQIPTRPSELLQEV
jgi:peptidoglycan/LPS O-acetylase OafA/YrhL